MAQIKFCSQSLNHPEIKEVYNDGTESPIQRPQDKDEQKDYFSGKKKETYNQA